MSGDGGERSNRRRQNIPSVSIRVLLGRFKPWMERTSRAGRQEGGQTGRQSDRQTDGSFFSFSLKELKGIFVYRRAESGGEDATSSRRLCACAAGSPPKQNQPQGRRGEDQKKKKRTKRKRRSHAFYNSLCVWNRLLLFPPSRPRRDSLIGAEETLSHHQDYCCLHSAKKAQRGQLLSASNSSSS